MIPKMDLSNLGDALTVFIINGEGGIVGEDEVYNYLDTIYKKIGCSCIDIISHKIEGKKYWVICRSDDRVNPGNDNLSALMPDDTPSHYGTLIITGYATGELGRPMMVSLTKDEIKMIYRHLGLVKVGGQYNTYCLFDLEEDNGE